LLYQTSMDSARPSLTAIVAATAQNVIGLDGDMPWRLSSDLRRFKALTMGGVMLMGRKTFDSIGRPLPGRKTVVLTRNRDWTAQGVETAVDPESALAKIGNLQGFVVGGAEIYRLLMPYCDRVLLTRVWSQVAGDTRLEIDLENFQIHGRMRIPAGLRDDVPTEFQDWRRKRS
jgi:dihydrofolate reductase